MPVIIDGTNGITQAGEFNSDSSFGFKNRIINGAMVFDQRNAGASLTNTTSFPYSLDRWQIQGNVASKYTAQQSSTAPTGFSNSLLITSTSAYSVAAADYFFFNQKIEGFNTADLMWGTANAKTVTISFWVQSSLTGTFGGSIVNSTFNYSYPFTYTISLANTWEQKSVTIAGPTAGTWVGATNGTGLAVLFGLGVGSTSSGTSGSWSANSYYSATGAVSVVGTNGATFYITGVQLEVGSTATSFDYRPYGTELALCQRYYYLLGRSSTFAWLGSAICADTVESVYLTPSPVPMRTTPSFSSSGALRLYNGTTRAITSSAISVHATPNMPATTFTASGGGLAAGQGVGLAANNDTAAFISYSAEL